MRRPEEYENQEEEQDRRNHFFRNLLMFDFLSDGDILGIFK